MCLAEKMFLGGQFVAFFLCHLILKLNLGTAVQKYLRHLNKKYFIKMLRPILFCFYKMIFFKVAQYIFLLSLEKVFFFFYISVMTHSDQNGKSDLDLFSFCVILSLVCENSSEKMDTKNSKA